MKYDAAVIRAWAIAEGLPVGERGRLHHEIVAEYHRVHATRHPTKPRIYRIRPWRSEIRNPWRAVVGGRSLPARSWPEALQLVDGYLRQAA